MPVKIIKADKLPSKLRKQSTIADLIEFKRLVAKLRLSTVFKRKLEMYLKKMVNDKRS